MRPTLLVAVLACLGSTRMRAQSQVLGTWSDAKFTLEVNVAGDNVTGIVTEKGLEPRRFSDGNLDGNTLVFTTVARLNGEDLVLEWRGEVTGDELTLRREFPSRRPLRRPYPPFNGPFCVAPSDLARQRQRRGRRQRAHGGFSRCCVIHWSLTAPSWSTAEGRLARMTTFSAIMPATAVAAAAIQNIWYSS